MSKSTSPAFYRAEAAVRALNTERRSGRLAGKAVRPKTAVFLARVGAAAPQLLNAEEDFDMKAASRH